MTTHSYRYRLYPDEKQKDRLEQTLDTCRNLYNHLLEEAKDNPFINKTTQQNKLPDLKKDWTELQDVHSKVLQMVNNRLHSNISRLEEDDGIENQAQAVDRLRYKGKGWYKSFTYNQSGFDLIETDDRLDKLYLSKIGEIPIRYHREIPDNAEVKEVTLKRYSSGHWYSIFVLEFDSTPRKPSVEDIEVKDCVGIDVGITNYVFDSDKLSVGSLDVSQELDRLKKEQRNLSRKERGSNNWEKQRKKLAQVHENIRNKRDDFLHKLSTYYVENYDVVAVEDLNITQMKESESSTRNKNVSHSAWGRFIEILEYKAEKAGTHLVKVKPQGTTKECAECGCETEKELWVREHSCPSCGYTADRDYNASRNVLQRGLNELGLGQAEVTPVDTPASVGTASSSTTTVSASRVVDAGSPFLMSRKIGDSR